MPYYFILAGCNGVGKSTLYNILPLHQEKLIDIADDVFLYDNSINDSNISLFAIIKNKKLIIKSNNWPGWCKITKLNM